MTQASLRNIVGNSGSMVQMPVRHKQGRNVYERTLTATCIKCDMQMRDNDARLYAAAGDPEKLDVPDSMFFQGILDSGPTTITGRIFSRAAFRDAGPTTTILRSDFTRFANALATSVGERA